MNNYEAVFDLKVLIDSFQSHLPDWYEASVLEFAEKIKGSTQTYNTSLFWEEVEMSHISELELPFYFNKESCRLDFINFMQDNLALMLTHANPELRKIAAVFNGFILKNNWRSPADLQVRQNELVEQLNNRLKQSTSKIQFSEEGSCFEVASKTSISVKTGAWFVIPSNPKLNQEITEQVILELENPIPGTNYCIFGALDENLQTFKLSDVLELEGYQILGGFHYAPGSNATDDRKGGDSIPQINPHSIWDLGWRPQSKDPRGMTLVDNNFWVDIYLTTEDNKATFGEPIKTNIDWWESSRILNEQGKFCPTEQEFRKLAFGTTEGTGADAPILDAGLQAAFTSKWGVMMSTGCYYIWGAPYRVDRNLYKKEGDV